VEAGSYSEQTLRANTADLARIRLRQKVLVDISNPSTETTLAGQTVALPLALSTVGISGLQHGNGEIHACRAAQAMNIPYTLSTLSICSIEDVAAAVERPFWFQLYVMKDRGFVRELIQRAATARCSALVLTVDLQVLGQRHADIRNGLSVPPALKLRTLLGMASHPRWLAGMLGSKRWSFGNLAGHVKDLGPRSLPIWIAHQFDPSLSCTLLDLDAAADRFGGGIGHRALVRWRHPLRP
jgi:L-lactate dehydrogenase (cytochrome)